MMYALKTVSRVGALALSVLLAGAAHAETFRLSTLDKPGSDGANAAQAFADTVKAKTGGKITITVYPASQLGDWTEVYNQVIAGAVDMAMQPLSTDSDKRLAITWFPYTFTDYASAAKALAADGYITRIVDEIIAEQGLKLMATYGAGMGGAVFAKEVNDPLNPNAKHNIKLRVWPGGTTHRALMERFGYNAAVIPWAELYTGMQTGVVDGAIGGTPELALDNFKDIAKTWIQYNDHFEANYMFMNLSKFQKLAPQDQKIVIDAAQEICAKRFEEVKAADTARLKQLSDAGVKVLELTPEQLQAFADVARKEVWPKLTDEVGAKILKQLQAATGAM
jgi:TRAP-type C4-dicarboxylate transport system substrate-binding protein